MLKHLKTAAAVVGIVKSTGLFKKKRKLPERDNYAKLVNWLSCDTELLLRAVEIGDTNLAKTYVKSLRHKIREEITLTETYRKLTETPENE